MRLKPRSPALSARVAKRLQSPGKESNRKSQWLAVAALLLLMAVGAVRDAAGANIVVTTTEQKISTTGGCSLQEAIYSANFDSNIAIVSTPNNLVTFITTGCEAGSGDDTIVLESGNVYQMGSVVDDPYNYMGPTATPIIFSNIIIEANGATLTHIPNGVNFRLFSVGTASIATPSGTKSGTGNLDIRNAYITGFTVKGGDGGVATCTGCGKGGGGGGMGAGGAIYVNGGTLTVESSTFERNGASGGNGSFRNGSSGGGGGGLAGDGGAQDGFEGGGGGGARGNGGNGSSGGGGGGGTLTAGSDGHDNFGGAGGFRCGGDGGGGGEEHGAADGQVGSCAGGGGGGGQSGGSTPTDTSGDAGDGNYGGGGGGGGYHNGSGGQGDFGGGGGAGGAYGGDGGRGGFGGGGGSGSDTPGSGGSFAGGASQGNGGGGAALGGAIFNHGGNVSIYNSTFTDNIVTRGCKGPSCEDAFTTADNGQDAGGAIFSVNGSLSVFNSTISNNHGTGSGAGIVVAQDGASTSFTLKNTIIANNGEQECFMRGSVSTDDSADNLITKNGLGGLLFEACPAVVVSNVDPQLGPLQLNVPGMTPTLAIDSNSPAYNKAAAGLSTDQRGVTRPQFGAYDIGAFEVGCSRLKPPANFLQATDPNQCSAVVTYPLPTTDGSCGVISCSPVSGSTFPLGETTVSCSTTLGLKASFIIGVRDTQAPAISAITVVQSSLKPLDHTLVNVGLTGGNINDNCSGSSRKILVYGNEDDQTNTGDGINSPDAANIDIGTLRLRVERLDSGNGRVYLIVAKVTDASGNTAFRVATVVVPKSQSVASMNAVNILATAAANYALSHNGSPPPGYFVIGDGPAIGSKQ